MFKKSVICLTLLPLLLSGCAAEGNKTRPPAVAGQFYPENPELLAKTVDQYLAQVPADRPEGEVFGLVSPHAGYPYSGSVAAHAYALLRGRKIERVVVVAPSHYESFTGASIFDGDSYGTPLGEIPVDAEFAKKLAASDSHLKLSDKGHTSRNEAGRGEHALEVQLPFLQRVLGRFKLVPVIMGDQEYETCRALGSSLASLIKGTDTVIVASSDLSHFHSYDEAIGMDTKLVQAVTRWDYPSLQHNLRQRSWEACGGGPIIAVMIAAEQLGANSARVLKQANSGDVIGAGKSSVVGYAAVAFLKGQVDLQKDYELGEAEQKRLLAIAHQSVEAAVREHRLIPSSDGGLPTLSEERGAFVTLNREGKLRGCIGYIVGSRPLHQTVRDVAAHAAVSDTRFLPVSVEELNQLDYEISVLSPLHRVSDPSQVQVGKHGLLIRKGGSQGVLLPQVASDNHWDRLTFLDQVCVKAGLPPGAWKDKDAELFSFTAFIFGEKGKR